jgi:hypothetical protein
VAVEGSVHQVNRVSAVDGEGTESRSTAADNKLYEFVCKHPLSDQRDSGGPRTSESILDTEHLGPYDSAGPLGSRWGLPGPGTACRRESDNRQIDLRTETPPRADRLMPNTAMRGAHPRPASKEINA